MQCLLHLNKHFTPFSLSFHWMSRYMSTIFSSLIASLADIFCLFLAVAHRKMWDGLYISGDCIPWLSVMYIEWVHRAKLASVCAEWRRHQHVGLYYVSLLIQTLCHISQPEITIQLLETEVIGSHWWSKCPHFWFRGSLMVAALAAGSSQSVHDPGLVIAAELTSTSAPECEWADPLQNTSQSVTSDLAQTRDNIYIMNIRLDQASLTMFLSKAKNDDPLMLDAPLEARCLGRLGRLVSKMCYSNM